MKKRFIKSSIVALAFIMVFGCLKDTTTLTFSADMVQWVSTRRMEGKIFVKGSEYRMDIKEGEENLSILVNRESGKQKVIVHSQKVVQEYLNTSAKSLNNNPFENFNYMIENDSSAKAGSEIINGYECTKIEVFNKGKKLLTAWVSDTLNWPIQITTAIRPSKDVKLSNIKEGEIVQGNLFEVPEGYKINSLPERKEGASQVKEVPPDIDKMREAVLEKVKEQGIELKTEEGKIATREFRATVLKRYFSGWKYFRVVRSKKTNGGTSSEDVPLMTAVVSNDSKTIYLLNSPDTDMSLDVVLKLLQNPGKKLDNEEALKDFGKALALLYFIGAKVESVESLDRNKWAVNLVTHSEKSSFFIVTLNRNRNITGVNYKIK
jgi:hypothetical protein